MQEGGEVLTGEWAKKKQDVGLENAAKVAKAVSDCRSDLAD